MKDDQERIRFVIRFTEMDLSRLRPGDILNLRDDLAAFLGPGFREVQALSSEELLLSIQNEAAWLLDTLVATVHLEGSGDRSRLWQGSKETRPTVGQVGPTGEGETLIILPVQTIKSLTFHRLDSGEVRLTVGADVREKFLSTLLLSLVRSDPTFLRRCAAGDCKRIFLAEHGRQEFCSPQCSRRTRVLRFRAAQQEREKKPMRKNTGRKLQSQEKK